MFKQLNAYCGLSAIEPRVMDMLHKITDTQWMVRLMSPTLWAGSDSLNMTVQ
jgi:hypothetical protein